MKLKTLFKENTILRVVYLLVFLFVITNEAIYSPDTRSYLNALPYRHPGYVIFLKSFKFLFSSFFDMSVLVFQGVFGLIAVNFFFKKAAQIFNLSTISKVILMVILIFPFFNPLYVANNICPEGLSYPLYLFFIVSCLDFIKNDSYKKLAIALFFYILLALTRGQFIFTPLIFAFAYFLEKKPQILKASKIFKLSLLICMPVVLVLTESTYHKLKDGIFMTTPFGFVNASTSAFYVSSKNDSQHIKYADDKIIFENCYQKLQNEELLMSSQDDLDSYTQYYNFFHKNVPPICNRTVHNLGKKYYFDKELMKTNSIKTADAQAFYNIEKTCKSLTLTLISNNFKKWIQLYFANISHGFYSSVLLIFIVFILLYSFVKVLFKNKTYILLFICAALTLSNAMLVAFASHSIMRYLFYNYVFIFFIFVIILTKLTKNGIKN
ncbi:glycosyltransferase family 39 protein [Psychroserpens luteus]|uniref:Glycosyltransferase family 39 protein n=1 Tax=Psychroserpens luteus TaxID=1434066 RepID=A0ABW5ZW30_9FLAO|nr:glycosyltransferase family 39 protein [Psychroserpens luteus]